MWSAMVLAAGFGSRLGPLTGELPKPLLPVGHVPLLLRLLRALHEGGAHNLVVNSHHLPEKIEGVTDSWHTTVHVSHEDRILGTAGGIRQALPLLDAERVVVANGDIFGDVPLEQLLAESFPGLTMLVRPGPVGSGTVGLGREGQVVRLRGEVFGAESSGGDYVGVAQVGPDALAMLPEEGCLVGDYALPLLRGGGAVRAVTAEVDFIDIGTPRAYLEANLAWLARHPEEGLAQGAELGARVHLESSLVGPGARVDGHGSLHRCVVLAGARVTAPLESAVVLPSGKIVSIHE